MSGNESRGSPARAAQNRARLKKMDAVRQGPSGLSTRPRDSQSGQNQDSPLALAGGGFGQGSKKRFNKQVRALWKRIQRFIKRYFVVCCPCSCGCGCFLSVVLLFVIVTAFLQNFFTGMGATVGVMESDHVFMNAKGQLVFSQAKLDKSQMNVGGVGASVEAIAKQLGIDLNNASIDEIYTVMRVAAEGGGNFATLVANDVGALGGGVGGWRGVNLFNVLKEIYSRDPSGFYNAAVKNGGKAGADWLVNQLTSTNGAHWETMTLSTNNARVVDGNVRGDAVHLYNAIQGALSTETSRQAQLDIMGREFAESVSRAQSHGLTNAHDFLLYADMDVNYGPGWTEYGWAQTIFSEMKRGGGDSFQSLVRTYEWREAGNGAEQQGLDYSGRLNGIVHPLVNKVRDAKSSPKMP